MIVYIIISPNFDMLNIYEGVYHVGKENEAKGSMEDLLESYLTMLDLEPKHVLGLISTTIVLPHLCEMLWYGS